MNPIRKARAEEQVKARGRKVKEERTKAPAPLLLPRVVVAPVAVHQRDLPAVSRTISLLVGLLPPEESRHLDSYLSLPAVPTLQEIVLGVPAAITGILPNVDSMDKGHARRVRIALSSTQLLVPTRPETARRHPVQ